MIAIIDYGAGNLRSVQKAFEHLGYEAVITHDSAEIYSADKVVLPGVGAFGDCMKNLNASNLIPCIKNVIERKKPFLGICLGLQLLFKNSEETPNVEGIGIFDGTIVKIPDIDDYKIPHMGWNSLTFTKPCPLFSNLPESPFVYFVHSYYMLPSDKNIVTATTEYCGTLPIALNYENVYAVQFHPEKSGDVGLKILENFAQL
ncbi:MAG: imidazole glycerol phosphate synthase subunit HisH [Oscillospiraceae bacterium]